jgi:hypothetical protein
MKHNQFFDQQTRCFKGGGGSKPKKVKTPPAPNMPAPAQVPEMPAWMQEESQRRIAAMEQSLLAQQAAMMEQNKNFEKILQEQIKPPEPPPPPATMSMLEVQEAEQNRRKDAGKRSGIRKTLLAGETGGYAPTATGKTLLG